jgi:hypothetical protein
MAVGQDTTYSGGGSIYIKQQPENVTLNGNTITTEEVTDAGGLQSLFGLAAVNGQILPGKIGFTIAPGAATHSTITVQVQDNGGRTIARTDGSTITAPTVWDLDIMLALATGVITNLTPSTGISVTTGTLLNTYVAGKALYVQTDATGKVVIDLLDTGKQGFYVMVQAGGQPVPSLSRQLVVGDYG